MDACNRITLPAEKEILLKKEEQFGKVISPVFPFGREVRGLTLEGFRYPLKEYTLTLGDGACRSAMRSWGIPRGSLTGGQTDPGGEPGLTLARKHNLC